MILNEVLKWMCVKNIIRTFLRYVEFQPVFYVICFFSMSPVNLKKKVSFILGGMFFGNWNREVFFCYSLRSNENLFTFLVHRKG